MPILCSLNLKKTVLGQNNDYLPLKIRDVIVNNTEFTIGYNVYYVIVITLSCIRLKVACACLYKKILLFPFYLLKFHLVAREQIQLQV